MNNYLKHPVAILALIGSLLLIVGGLLSWITIPAGSALDALGGELKDAIQTKQYVALGAGVLSGLFTFLGAQKASKGMAIFSMVLGVIAFLIVMTGYASPDELALVGLEKMDLGFYLALVGSVDVFFLNLVGLFVFKKQA